MTAHGGCAPRQGRRPDHDVGDILRAHGDEYRAAHVLTPEQRKATWAIEHCRTSVLGGHVDVCADCGHQFGQSYNSCRNRHCPKCQALDQHRWVERRMQRLVATHYFHVVLTVPSELHSVARRNAGLFYDLLFRVAAQTLLELGRDPKRLGALLAITAVLHTWTRDLRFHPHLHCIVTGGGLSSDRQRWVDAGGTYLLPVRVISLLFRGKFLDALARLNRERRLSLPDELNRPAAFERLLATLYAKDWVVYAKRPFAGPQQIFRYLGHYTHRVAISNYRILDVTPDRVTISTRDGGTATMTPQVFIRRFLQHVLPKGFIKIRHYGLAASCHVRTLLATAQRLLGAPYRPPEPDIEFRAAGRDDWRRLLLALARVDLLVCPFCGSTRLHRTRLPAHTPRRSASTAAARAPPLEATP